MACNGVNPCGEFFRPSSQQNAVTLRNTPCHAVAGLQNTQHSQNMQSLGPYLTRELFGILDAIKCPHLQGGFEHTHTHRAQREREREIYLDKMYSYIDIDKKI